MVADPKVGSLHSTQTLVDCCLIRTWSISSQALQYILHKSGYHFVKGAVSVQIVREINGESGLVSVTGQLRHSRCTHSHLAYPRKRPCTHAQDHEPRVHFRAASIVSALVSSLSSEGK